MIDAAENFLTEANSVSWHVRNLLWSDSVARDAGADPHDFTESWGRLRRAQLRVDLIFGETSSASDRADDLVQLIRKGVAAVESVATDPDGAKWLEEAQASFLVEADVYDAFLNAAHDLVAPRRDE